MKKKIVSVNFLLILLSVGLPALLPGACASQASAGIDTIKRGTGQQLGTVYANAAVFEDRTTGIVSGDTLKYGYIEGVGGAYAAGRTAGKPAVLWKLRPSASLKVPGTALEKALANALYDIIQQARKNGGNAVTDVLTNIDRSYDPQTRIETVKVSVSAEVIKTAR